MKQIWAPQELIDHWTLSSEEIHFVTTVSKADYNQVGCAVLLKCFQMQGKFLQRKQDVSNTIVEHMAQQLKSESNVFYKYDWTSRTIEKHRSQIRRYLGFQIGTVTDAQKVTAWLSEYILTREDRQFDSLKEVAYERYRELKIEPPQPQRLYRIICSALRSADERFYTETFQRLTPDTREKLDALLMVSSVADNAATGTSALYELKSEAGVTSLETVLTEIAKLERIKLLGLSSDLFSHTSPKTLNWFKHRVAVEGLHEVKRHPASVRYTLLAAFCWQRSQEISDTLVDLLINLIHRIGTRAERTVDKELLKDIKRVHGKNKLFYEFASASLENPDETVRNVIYPVVPEQTLRDLIAEFKQNGTYDQKVQTVMRGSYSNHYRRMVPALLKSLTFASTRTAPQSILAALELIRKYANKNMAYYPEDEVVPLDGIVPKSWLPLVKQGQWVNRISYELCVLKVAREKLRCKEIYAEGAYRYRSPDEDLPSDFTSKRQEYYADLYLPLSADEFIAKQKQEMREALERLDRYMPKNKSVEITTKHGKPWIRVAKIDPQPEPQNLASLKFESGNRTQVAATCLTGHAQRD